jgi:hypothetical protein
MNALKRENLVIAEPQFEKTMGEGQKKNQRERIISMSIRSL